MIPVSRTPGTNIPDIFPPIPVGSSASHRPLGKHTENESNTPRQKAPYQIQLFPSKSRVRNHLENYDIRAGPLKETYRILFGAVKEYVIHPHKSHWRLPTNNPENLKNEGNLVQA